MATDDDEYQKETVTYDDLTFTIQEWETDWETDNKTTKEFLIEYKDDILDQDIYPELGQRINLMWIKNIRNKMNWKEGEKLYIFTKQKCDDNFWCRCSKEKKNVCFVNMMIDSKGYALNRYHNQYIKDDDDDDEIYFSFLIRSSSVYNDMRCDELNHSKIS